MSLRSARHSIMAAVLALGAAGRVSADGGLTFGVEATSVFDQEMVLLSNPSVTRLRTDTLTSLSTLRSGDYFTDFDSPAGSSVTTIRTWEKIDHNATYVFLKTSYATEYLEVVAKLGGATKKIIRTEKSLRFKTPQPAGAPIEVANVGERSNVVDLPPDFAYGFELKGQPYDSELFSVMTSLYFMKQTNNGRTSETFDVGLTTGGTQISNNVVNRSVEMSQINYGLTASAMMKFESFMPYLGLGYGDGRLKSMIQTSSIAQTFTNGNLTASSTTAETIEFTLKPKIKPFLAIGFNFPFEKGGVNVEFRIRGETSMTVGGFIAF